MNIMGTGMWSISFGIVNARLKKLLKRFLATPMVVRDPSSGLLSHCVRAGSYKTYDRYAEEKGLPNQTFTVCPVAIIDPEQPDDSAQCVTIHFDPAEAADYLTWKRKKWARKRAS